MSKVIIVGAGVIGLTCAHELRRSGFEVTILDRCDPGGGCSWGNMGWIVPSFARPLPAPGLVQTSLRWMLDRASPLYIKPRPDLDLARWFWGFWRHCNERDHHAGLCALAGLAAPTMAVLDRMRAAGIEFEMHRSGVLFLFMSRDARDAVRRGLDFMAAGSDGAPRGLERDEVREMEPHVRPEVAAGIFVAQERHVRPESLVAGLVRRLQEIGVTVQAGGEVSGVRRRGRSVTAMATGTGDVGGDLFLLAAGAWSGRLARSMGVHLPIQAGKGYSITIEHPAWQPAHALYLDEARVAWSPFDGQGRVGGTMEFSGLNTDVHRRRLDAIRAAAGRYLRDWPTGAGETEWAGLRPLTPDGLPVLGRMPGYDNVFVATGHGMLGVTLAPSTAVVMRQLLRTGVCDIDLEPFRPGRFGPSAAQGIR